MSVNTEKPLINKETLYAGNKYIPLQPGTRVKFHFETRKVSDGKLLDNSRNMTMPMELVMGKKFKLEVWEVIVQKMALNEVAKFTVDKSLVTQYPFISKTLREVGKKTQERRHCCGMTMQNEGTGHKDLDDLFMNPTDLEFTIELISIELPEQYEKERWQLSDEEKVKAASNLHEKGNSYYKEKQLDKAEECYRHGIGLIEQLMLKEKPHDTEWLQLAAIKVPLLLNFAQCRLLADDYYSVIQHCNEVLDIEPDNVKAIYRRAKAHFGAWNPNEARQDYMRAVELDKTLQSAVNKELKSIDDQMRIRDLQDKIKLQKLF